jgi:hypothetical protein
MGTGTITRAELKIHITAVHFVTRGSRQFLRLFIGFCAICLRSAASTRVAVAPSGYGHSIVNV